MSPARKIFPLAVLLLATVAAARGDARHCHRQPTLVCEFHPMGSNRAVGRVIFRPAFVRGTCCVHISAAFAGLTPNSMQAWHIHKYGDMSSSDGKAAGGHFTAPWQSRRFANHGYPGSFHRHWGDLGNLRVDKSGRAYVSRYDRVIRISGILGRGMIIHASMDKGSEAQPSGGAGKRVSQCVIGFANPDRV